MEPNGASEQEQISEGHRLDIFGWGPAPGPLAVSLQISLHPHECCARFAAVVLENGSRPVVLVDEEIPLPTHGWEIRATGLWADQHCEIRNEHWTYGLEAFALAIDSPDQLVHRAFGDRVPLGWELDFESDREPEELSTPGESWVQRQIGRGHGLLLGPHDPIDLDGMAVRHHWRGFTAPDRIVVGRPGGDDAVLERACVPFRGGTWGLALLAGGLRCAWRRPDPSETGQ